ncbi:MAG TPA: LptF/LptG family permease, partial [Vicinamibacterales bacterium]|nr:LptF/LptG family permease [Vicinamibacterales bacterium]
MTTLDRYLIREILPPFFLALVVFTFILQVPPLMDRAESLIAKGVPWLTVGHLLALLLPQALGLTIPMAVLVGLLVAFGRLSGDRELVAMLACGISLYRLLRPVMLLAVAAAGATMWVLIVGIPDANQRFNEITYEIIAARVEHDVRPRVFFEDFPGRVVYVQDTAAPAPGWRNVFLADTSTPARPVVYLARRGRMLLDRGARRVELVLSDGWRYNAGERPGDYEISRFEGDLILSLDPSAVFPAAKPPRGLTELRIADLREQIRLKRSQGLSPHNEIMQIQQKFSIPAACLIFGLLGLALGATARRDGRLAGFVIGIGVIFVYYVLMYLAEAMTKGHVLPAVWARWVPNVVLAPVAVALLVRRARRADAPIAPALPRLPGRTARPEAVPRARVRVVLRVPRLWYPRPTVLDGYVTRLYLRVFGLAVAALLGLFYIATFVDLSERLFKGQATGRMLLAFFWYQTPQFIYYVIPLATLLATLATIGLLTRTNELTVMKACGISLYRVAAPLVLAAVAGSLMLFSLEERVLARANRRAEALNAQMRGRTPRTFNALNRQWVAGRDGRTIYHYAFFDAARRELVALSVYTLDASAWRLERHLAAERAAFDGRGWTLRQGRLERFSSGHPPAFEGFTERRLPLEPPDYFETEQPDAELMTYSELRRHVRDLRASGFDVVALAVALHRKLAFPFVTVVMTLLAVPFAAMHGRRGALYAIGLGIALAITYWLLVSAFAALGSGGLLP